jgi:hypothetical protein
MGAPVVLIIWVNAEVSTTGRSTPASGAKRMTLTAFSIPFDNFLLYYYV